MTGAKTTSLGAKVSIPSSSGSALREQHFQSGGLGSWLEVSIPSSSGSALRAEMTREELVNALGRKVSIPSSSGSALRVGEDSSQYTQPNQVSIPSSSGSALREY